MDISVARKAVIGLVCIFIFSTCGELEMMIPSNETYQVRALVNGNSLEECTIIRSNDKIRPYFTISVVNDPDLIGLMVYLKNTQGKIAGDKVQYTLLPYAGETALTEKDLQEENETAEPVHNAEDDTTPPERQSSPIIEIAVKSFTQELPFFPLPKELEIGHYILAFEALGKKEILSHMETSVIYLGNAEFNLRDISMYLPGLSGQQLISPETVIMLKSTLDFDSRLDPYVIWYNGKTIIKEGKISDGAGNILWKAPEQAGIHSLRLEALPFNLKRPYTGISREITLPVSPRAISLGYFFDKASPAPELLQWYQFEGDIRSSLSTVTDEQLLLPTKKTSPRWAVTGQSYGLSIAPEDPYLLPPVKFFRNKADQGGGILLFHIRPLSEGIIFSASFPRQAPATGEGARMDMIKAGNAIALRLSAADTFVDLPVYLDLSAAESLIPIAVEFYIRPYRLEAKISLEGLKQNQTGAVLLPGALSGEGRISLGDGLEKSILDKLILEQIAALAALTFNSPQNSAEEISVPSAAKSFPDTIWDEFAILLSAVPLIPEELLETAAEEKDAVFMENTDHNNSVQERETQELATLTVLSENF
jgi:hypothetical protein